MNEPSILQEKAVHNIMNGDRPGKAMIKAGYSEVTAKDPGKNLLRKQAVRKLMDKYLSDTKLFEAHERALNATKRVLMEDGNVEEQPDYAVQLRAAVEGYKVKGYSTVEHGDKNTQININWDTQGYVPPSNTQQIKQTYTPKSPKRT